MEKPTITQEELDQGTGNFNQYMLYVKQRIAGKTTPEMAIFSAVSQIAKDGFKIEFGSFSDDAAKQTQKWFDNHFGERAHISYCFHPVAYEIGGNSYQFRMPMMRVEEIPLIEAVEDITEENASSISNKKFLQLVQDYNELYDAMYNISAFSPITSIHVKQACNFIMEGSSFYSLSRWDSLYFVEKAMKEILEPLGVQLRGADGHDIQGALHSAWQSKGLQSLPEELLTDVMCSSAMRYNETTQPLSSALKAHHSSIRLGAIIANYLPAVEKMGEELHIKAKQFSLAPSLNIAKIIAAVDPTYGSWPPVRIMR